MRLASFGDAVGDGGLGMRGVFETGCTERERRNLGLGAVGKAGFSRDREALTDAFAVPTSFSVSGRRRLPAPKSIGLFSDEDMSSRSANLGVRSVSGSLWMGKTMGGSGLLSVAADKV